MKISFITTIFNEEGTIGRFLDSLLIQTRMPEEIIIVDGGSRDNTVQEIEKWKTRKKIKNFKVLVKRGNRSVGRNEAIRHTSGEIIVCSDSGNILDKDWLKNIIEPFKKKDIDVVAGYYKGKAENVFQKCVIPYALVMSDQVNPQNFLPATRSVAFTKVIWKKVGGFDEKLSHNEDYAFAKALQKIKAHIVLREDAIVYWIPRDTFRQAFVMMFRFAYGDAEARIWRPKVFLVFIRYVLALILLVNFFISRSEQILEFITFILILYIVWSVRKNYRYVKDVRAVIILPLLQFTADCAVILGTSTGILSLYNFKVRQWKDKMTTIL
ncbi:MAG TPA: glycosyltransferase [Candidatus Saccharimonadales bacterium]|nr:glycosyltransferase [Candidatus Saccharimonadales bacterium]